jgi:hypothetical protein
MHTNPANRILPLEEKPSDVMALVTWSVSGVRLSVSQNGV